MPPGFRGCSESGAASLCGVSRTAVSAAGFETGEASPPLGGGAVVRAVHPGSLQHDKVYQEGYRHHHGRHARVQQRQLRQVGGPQYLVDRAHDAGGGYARCKCHAGQAERGGTRRAVPQVVKRNRAHAEVHRPRNQVAQRPVAEPAQWRKRFVGANRADYREHGDGSAKRCQHRAHRARGEEFAVREFHHAWHTGCRDTDGRRWLSRNVHFVPPVYNVAQPFADCQWRSRAALRGCRSRASRVPATSCAVRAAGARW